MDVIKTFFRSPTINFLVNSLMFPQFLISGGIMFQILVPRYF